jgi:hypothetical protein
MEIWKKIKQNEDYEISNYGRVKYLGCIKSVTLRKDNYCYVYLKNSQKNHLIHRLVAQEFLTNFDCKKMVNHIDFNKTNNHVDNLEMVTNRENQCHLIKSNNKYIGVSYQKKYNKWISQIMFNKKLIHIGTFATEQEAYKARINFEKHNGILNKYL